jgi:hypothetical protein
MTYEQKWSMSGIGLVFLALMFASCGVFLNKTTMSPEEALRSRVTAYWDARVKDSPEKAYELLDPDARKATNLASYIRRTSHSSILSYKIHDINVDLKKNEGTVRVEHSFRIRPGAIPINIPDALNHTADDLWVLVDGQWYKSYSPPALNSINLPTRQPENGKR